ncbi:hypothetical protein F7P69_04210 [Cellulosimicrobium funkei]|nr:hypothetical protein [Cellulosimicrobium funkei]
MEATREVIGSTRDYVLDFDGHRTTLSTAVHTAGTAFKTTADDARSAWRDIATWVTVPDETSLVNAFDKPQDMG